MVDRLSRRVRKLWAPLPDLLRHISPLGKTLPSGDQEAAVREFQVCDRGRDWAFARTEKQFIEAAADMWGGIRRP